MSTNSINIMDSTNNMNNMNNMNNTSNMNSMDLENTYTSGVYGKRPVTIVRGQGASLWDAEGRAYIDCMAGHGVANIGHGRPEIAAALSAQAQRLITCPETVYNDVRARLLERLAQVTPAGLSHFFFCNSGTEAIEGAFKFARLATGRTGIVATLRGFHGRSMGALSATWEKQYREPFAPLLPDVSHMRYNDLRAAETAITEQTAAVVIELVQAEGGVHVAQEAYVQGLAALCRERGALLIIDEIQTGFGRTGTLFACEQYGVEPDILCLAKSIAGGVPMGAIALGTRVMESGRVTRGVHGSTFGGNPLACAAALATLDILIQEDLAARAATLGAHAQARLRTIQSPLIREVRGRGLLIGIELTKRVQPYLEALCERGVLALPAGPNVLRLLPPLVISQALLDEALDRVTEVLAGPPASERARQGVTETRQRNELFQKESSSETETVPIEVAETERVQVEAAHALEAAHTREVALLQSMLQIQSLSRQEGALAHFLVAQAQQLGLYAYVDEVGNFVASTHAGIPAAGTEPVVLLGHMDTVPGIIPVRIEDGLLYGRGAVDAKGPLAAFICATARMARQQTSERPIVVVGAVEEEATTSRGARGILTRYQPSACIIGEPSGSQAVTIGYKGCLCLDGWVTQQASHSAGPGQSSNEIAARFWERVRRHAEAFNQEHAGTSTFAALLPSLRSINSQQDGLEERTSFTIGYRLPPAYDSAALRTQLQFWASEDAIQLRFSGEEMAYQTNRTIPLARAFSSAIRASGAHVTFKHKTGTSDMNVVGPHWGQNIVAYGPGDSRLDHTPHEHIRLTEYLQAIDVLEAVLHTIVPQRKTT